MAGTVKRMLSTIIEVRGAGRPVFMESTRAKLILKGLNPEKFNDASPDDPAIIARVRAVADEFGVKI